MAYFFLNKHGFYPETYTVSVYSINLHCLSVSHACHLLDVTKCFVV